MGDSTAHNYSLAEIRHGIEALTEAELCQIRKTAGTLIYIGDLNWDIDDLLQESVKRLLDGRRNWRRDMTLASLIIGVIRSIAHGEHSTPQFKTEILETDLYSEQSGENDGRYLDNVRGEGNPILNSQEIEYQSNVLALLESLNSDRIAKDILLGHIYGYKRAEIIERLLLTPKEFDTANRRLKRRIGQFVEHLGDLK